jgi:hypothetical protein
MGSKLARVLRVVGAILALVALSLGGGWTGARLSAPSHGRVLGAATPTFALQPAYVYSPAGGDDAPNLVALINSGIRVIQFADNSTIHINTPLVFPLETPVRLIGNASVTISCAVTAGALGSSQFCLYADGWDPAANAGVRTTLSADAAVGATQITVASTAGLSVGSAIILGPATQVDGGPTPTMRAVQSAYVLGLPGGNVVQLGTKEGAPIALDYAFTGSGSTNVYLSSQGFPRGIQIEGHGMTVTGSGGGLFEATATWESSVTGVKLVASGVSNWVAGWDIGSRDCLFSDLTVQQLVGPSAPPMAVILAYTHGTSIFRSHVDGAFGAAGSFAVAGARAFVIDACSATNGSTGLMLNDEAGPPGVNDSLGDRWGQVRSFVALKNSVTGINIQDGGSGYSLTDCTSLGSPDAMLINTQNTSSYPDNIRIVGGTYQGSTSGIKIAGGTRLHIQDVNVSGSGTGIYLAGTAATTGVSVVGVTADSCTSNGMAFTGSNVSRVLVSGGSVRSTTGAGVSASCSDLTIDGLDFTDAGIGASNITASAGALITIRDSRLGWSGVPGSNSNAILGSGAQWVLENNRYALPTSPSHQLAFIASGSASDVFRMHGQRGITNGASGNGLDISFGLLSNAACTFYDLGDVDFTVTNYPASGGFNTQPSVNWGTWTATGSAVTLSHVSSPSAAATFSFILTAASGTVGAPFQATAISGSSVTVNSTNTLDRSTYTWHLQALLDPWAFLALARALRRRFRRAPANDVARAAA